MSDKALEVVDGYFLLQNHDAYHKARADLKKRFGDPFTVSEAFRSKIESWPIIRAKDHEGLRKFSDFLQQCLTAQGSISQLHILNDNRENKKIVAKLPDFVTRKWVRLATNYNQKHSVFPKFATFCQFLSKEADVSCNPLFHDLKQTEQKQADHKPPRNKQYDHKRTYATQQGVPNQSDENKTKPNNTDNKKQCLHCNMSNHTTAECGKVNYLPFAEQHAFLRSHHLCFACLDGKHSYKECKAPATCKTCKGNHPSALHRMKTTPRSTPANQGQDPPQQQSYQKAETQAQPKVQAPVQQAPAPVNSSQ